MNTSIQHPELNGIVQPSGDLSQSEATLSALRNSPGRFTFAALLAGLLLLLFSAPSARAQGIPPGCTGSGIGITLFTSSPDVHINDTICYSVLVYNGTGVGPIVCDASNIVASVVTPDGVTHPITLSRTYLSNVQSDYYPNVFCYVVRAQDIRSDGTVRATASDTATIYQNDTPSQGSANQAVNTEVSQPCIGITAQCVPSAGQNGAIIFTGTVTNCGNNTLVGVTVTNSVNGGQFQVAFFPTILAHQAASFSGSYIPLNPCLPSTATFTARGSDQFTTLPVTVTAFATTICQNTLTQGIKVTKVCPPQPVSPGQLLTFSGSVSNTGNVTLTNIVVVNSQPAANTPVFTLASLAPGAVANFNGSYTAPANCSVFDTLTATAASLCGVAVTDFATATCPITTAPAIVVTQTCPTTQVGQGGLLTYSGTVQNTGNITLTNVVVLNNLSGATPVIGPITLAPGASANFTGSYVAPFTDSCSVSSIVTATGRSICGVAVANSFTATCPLTTAPAIVVTQTCPTGPVFPGGLLTYSGTVWNTGNITLTNVVVLNNRSGTTPVIGPITLAPGASANFTGSYVAPITDSCSVSSTVNATGRSICGVAVINSATATCPITTAPAIVVTQTCPTPVLSGGLLTYSGTVQNTGNITLTNVVVLNNLSGATPVIGPITLAPGASANFTGSYVAPINSCSVSSIVTATGRSICGVAAANSFTATCPLTTAPAIVVTQTCPTGPVFPGGLLTYSGTVQNTGNITLTNVVVLNNLSGATPVIGPITLAPGASANFTGSYVAPINSCSVSSIVTATGRSICGVAAANSFTATCPLTTAPAIVVTQTCPTTQVGQGGLLTYSGTVWNTGNITLTNVVVLNNLSGTTPVIGPITLAPGASANFTGSYVAPFNSCSVSSIVTATGRSICGVAVANSATATCPITTAPAIAVTQTCPTTPVLSGGLLTYSGTVWNTGNITLNNVVVLNNLSGATPVIGPITLAPGASANFTGSYVAPTDACSVSSTVTATGNDNCTQALVSDSRSATCPLITTSGIKVTKSCLQPVPPGQTLYFSGSVSNTGNVTLTNIVVLNSQPAPNTQVFTWLSLAPGEVQYFNNGYMVLTNFGPVPICSVADTLTATATSRCGQFVTDTTSANCPILTTPAIVVTVYCPPNPVGQGGYLTYSGTVSNAGNITLTNIWVTNNWPYIYPIYVTASLPPGATVNFQGHYYVPLNCCEAWLWVVASGQGCDGVTVTDTDSRTCPVLTSPSIVVTKVCVPTMDKWGNPVLLRPGKLLTYSGTVCNTGNITLMNVTVVDDQPANNTPVIDPINLAPGECKSYAGSYIVPPDFCGQDTVTARGFNVCGGAVSNSATTICPIAPYSPRIGVTKQCPPQPTPHGGLLTFTGTVTNMGDVTLVNVFVVNNVVGRPISNTPVIGPITLAPGASFNFTGSYTADLVCCEMVDTLTARGQDICLVSNVTATATAICPMLYTPGIALVQDCPPNLLPGSVYPFRGFVTNTGDAILTNVVVFSSQAGQILPLLGPLDLAPGESEPYTGSLTVPLNTFEVTVTVTGQETCEGTWITDTVSCPVAAPGITITENCPPGPVTNGSSVAFGGLVCNSGTITLTNIFVFSGQPGNPLVLGPITLLPGACQSFTGSYIATGGSNPTTNTNIVTHVPGSSWTTITNVITTTNTVTFTTNTAIPFWFGTINSVAKTYAYQFPIGSNFNGLTYDAAANGYEAMDFYSIRRDTTGASWYDSIIASTATVTDRFAVPTIANPNLTFDALTYAADNVGYGPLLFYYLSHDNAGITWFGSITPGGVVGVTANLFPVGINMTFDVLTYTAADVGYGANMFYYIRHDTNGVSWFGTINPTPGGSVLDRFTVGTNSIFVGLTFTDLIAPGYGANNFYYLRQDTNGVSTFGTLHLTQPPTPPISAVVTDRFPVGANAVELTYTFDNPAFGANLFYFLHGRNFSVTSNSVTTYQTNAVTLYTTNTSRVDIYTTNIVVSFTPTNTVTVIGMGIGQGQTVTATATNCVPTPFGLVIGTPTMVNGIFSLSFPTENGKWYYVQYKDALTDPAWIILPGTPVPGTGVPLTSYDPDPAFLHPSRFYRVVSMP